MNKVGDVTPEGEYVSPIKDSKKRLGKFYKIYSNLVLIEKKKEIKQFQEHLWEHFLLEGFQ